MTEDAEPLPKRGPASGMVAWLSSWKATNCFIGANEWRDRDAGPRVRSTSHSSRRTTCPSSILAARPRLTRRKRAPTPHAKRGDPSRARRRSPSRRAAGGATTVARRTTCGMIIAESTWRAFQRATRARRRAGQREPSSTSSHRRLRRRSEPWRSNHVKPKPAPEPARPDWPDCTQRCPPSCDRPSLSFAAAAASRRSIVQSCAVPARAVDARRCTSTQPKPLPMSL
jgi:hypothetical protein